MYVSRIGRAPAPMVADFKSQVANNLVTVLERADQVCGFIVFYPRQAEHVHIENVAVLPHCQGMGYGKALVQYVEQQAMQSGYSSIELYTNTKMTENLSFYPALGYREIDRRRQDGFDRVFYTKSLTD
jgi:ribosomal protein S18 acetylase RimI-like enzyme